MEMSAVNIKINPASKRDTGVATANESGEKQDFSSILSNELPTQPKEVVKAPVVEKVKKDELDEAVETDPAIVAANVLPVAPQTEVPTTPINLILQTLTEEAADAQLKVDEDIVMQSSDASLKANTPVIKLTDENTEIPVELVNGELDLNDTTLADLESQNQGQSLQPIVTTTSEVVAVSKEVMKVEDEVFDVDPKIALDISKMESGLGLQEPAPPVVGQITNHSHQPFQAISANNVKIDQPVGNSEWREAFSERVLWLSNQNIKSANMQLNPQELGPIEISVKVTQQQAAVMINAQHGATREAIADALPTLRAMLEENGIQLQDVTVNERSSQDRNQEAFQSREDDPGFTSGYVEPSRDAGTTRITQTRLNAIDYYA